MGYPPILQVPGTKISTVGSFVEFFNAINLQHYQVTVDLRAIPGGASLELQMYIRDPSNTVWLKYEPSQTFGPGAPSNRDVIEWAFSGQMGVKLDGKQTGGSPTTYTYWITKV